MSVDKRNLAIVRQSFTNAAFSHKTHEMAAERKERRSIIFKVLNITLITLVLGLLVTQTIIPTNLIFSYIGAGLTGAEIALLIIHLSFNIEPEIVSHKNTALKYMSLRDRYKLLIADILSGAINANEIVRRRDDLLREYQTISDLALQTNQNDYDNAMSRLKIKEEQQNIWSDKQIDGLLPKELRSK
jgi:hypothetical protein